jgi:hypothetical protein
MRRDLFVTAAMLEKAGLPVDVRLVQGSIEVSLAQHRATFPAAKADEAANWLAACVVMHYPESEMAKLWVMLATVAGGAIPFGSP